VRNERNVSGCEAATSASPIGSPEQGIKMGMIEIVAAVVRDDEGRLLLVRKRNTTAFMQPGGKREPGETDLEALAREVHEELGCYFDAAGSRPLGRAQATAANEPGHLVEAEIYSIQLQGEIEPAAEIDAIVWVNPLELPDLPLAPLTEHVVLPMVRRMGRS
jgi:8-oxo-dGTP diphosphatase